MTSTYFFFLIRITEKHIYSKAAFIYSNMTLTLHAPQAKHSLSERMGK